MVGEIFCYINEFIGMLEIEKEVYIVECEVVGIILIVCFVVNEFGIYKWIDMVKGDIEFEGFNIGGDWVI